MTYNGHKKRQTGPRTHSRPFGPQSLNSNRGKSMQVRITRPSERNTPLIGVHIGRISLYFSYETVIAFSLPESEACRENDWGPTTGRHMNELGFTDKSKRIPSDKFEEMLTTELAELGLSV